MGRTRPADPFLWPLLPRPLHGDGARRLFPPRRALDAAQVWYPPAGASRTGALAGGGNDIRAAGIGTFASGGTRQGGADGRKEVVDLRADERRGTAGRPDLGGGNVRRQQPFG